MEIERIYAREWATVSKTEDLAKYKPLPIIINLFIFICFYNW